MGNARDITGALFDDQVIDRDKIRGGKSQFGKHQVNAVQAKGDLLFEQAQIGLLQAGTIPDDERRVSPGEYPLIQPGAPCSPAATDENTPPADLAGASIRCKPCEGHSMPRQEQSF